MDIPVQATIKERRCDNCGGTEDNIACFHLCYSCGAHLCYTCYKKDGRSSYDGSMSYSGCVVCPDEALKFTRELRLADRAHHHEVDKITRRLDKYKASLHKQRVDAALGQ